MSTINKRKNARQSSSADVCQSRKNPRTAGVKKGARRMADVSPELKAELERGTAQTATLVEGLSIDFAVLLQTVFPDAGDAVHTAMDSAAREGIIRRMVLAGTLLWSRYGMEGVARCRLHTSDTVRGWGCFMLGAQSMPLAKRLDAIRPFADDPHFGVREWAWLAVRPHLAAELGASIMALSEWTQSSSAYIRRFACESLRPRGVWCAHINALKQAPEQALPVLEPLAADPVVYVQDSVANWLNDAAKHQPDWVKAVCVRWQAQYPEGAATRRICTRALRSLK